MAKALNLGMIGYGFMGRAHTNGYKRVADFFPDIPYKPVLKAACARDAEKIKAFAHDSKKEAVAEGKKMIAATDKQIAELKQAMAKSTGEAKKAHEQNMQDLQAKRKAAQAELDRMQKSAANTWDATKEGFSNAYKDLQEAYEKAKAGQASK